jgi:hypothetical protein
MIRILNFTLVLVTGLFCLGVYRVAEEARVTVAELKETKAAIAQENQSLAVLGAEWAKVTQPARIQALAERYLNLNDRPVAQLASVSQLPPKFLAQPEDAIRNANAIIPQPGQRPLPGAAPGVLSGTTAARAEISVHTGT